MRQSATGGWRAGMILHLTTSRSSLVRLTPVAHALAAMGVPQAFFDPTAATSVLAGVISGRPPQTRDFMAATRRPERGAEAIMAVVEDTLDRLEPTTVTVAGDSEATVAGALAASKLGVPVARIGAGLRTNDWGLREEVARVVLDGVASRLYTDGQDADITLASQGIAGDRIEAVGSTLADSVVRWRGLARERAAWTDYSLKQRQYLLVTLHREENLQSDDQVVRIARGLRTLARRLELLLVLHPRTRAALASVGELDALKAAGAALVDPLDYVDFLSLEAGAGAVLTDSSGVQEEATMLGVPCFTLRRTTERTLTLTHGTNVLLGDDPGEIAEIALRAPRSSIELIPQWDGHAGWRIATDLLHAVVGAREA